jgi:hypothetical protein
MVAAEAWPTRSSSATARASTNEVLIKTPVVEGSEEGSGEKLIAA